MKYCSKCGHQLIDEAVICVKCGCGVGRTSVNHNKESRTEKEEVKKYCHQCGHQLIGKAVICTNCGCGANVQSTNAYEEKQPEKDEADTGLLVLSVVVPVVGFILWALKNKETPKAAKTYGMASLIVCGVWLIIQLFIYASISSTINGIMDGIINGI